MNKRLYRSKSNSMLGGVCAGLGAYLDIDATLVRIFFVLLALTNGFGLLVYLVLWVLLPREDRLPESGPVSYDGQAINERAHQMGDELRQAVHTPNQNLPIYIGIGLIVLGGFALLNALPFPWLHQINEIIFWPALLVLAGIVLLMRGTRKE